MFSAETFGVAEAGDAVGGVAEAGVPLLDESNLAEDRTVERWRDNSANRSITNIYITL